MSPPEYPLDFYSDELLSDPYPHYKAMRDLGPAVWLPRNDCWALTRFVQVRDALRNSRVFISGNGVMMNEPTNLGARNSILCMDDPQHREMRNVLIKPLTPAALAALREQIESMAAAQVETLIERGRFDGVKDFAHYLPLAVVSHIVGLPQDGRAQMLDWANSIFNCMGPLNPRCTEGFAARDGAVQYLQSVRPGDLLPDSWGARLFAAVEAGQITDVQARSMLFDYVAPALDTTINATSGAIWLLGQNPNQWSLVRDQPQLIGAAIDEAMRLESPIRAFSRFLTEPQDFDGTTVPAGARTLVVYASANRDERHWPDAETFNIQRKSPHEQLGFGTGVHMCAGMHLAKLEMRALFGAFAKRVRRFTVGEPRRTLHNVLRGLDSLQITIEEVAGQSS